MSKELEPNLRELADNIQKSVYEAAGVVMIPLGHPRAQAGFLSQDIR